MSRYTRMTDGQGWWILDADGSKRPYRWYHALGDRVYNWWISRDYRRRQRDFARNGTRYYGDGGTIHHTTLLDIEMYNGKPVSVWFRCSLLPFDVHEVDRQRAHEMTGAYKDGHVPDLHGVELRDKVRP